MISDELTLINRLGLHARAAGKLVTTTARYESNIQLGTAERMVDGKSIMSIMLLAASCGTQVQVQVDGADEEEAFAAIEQLFNDRFGEPE